MTAPSQTSYDVVPYESAPFAQSHPDRLAVVATLLGLRPVHPNQCRVLELGCASGGNLIGMAQSLPDSTFLGVDASSRQIADGQKVLEATGLKNIEMRHLDILDVTPDLGLFDYIICHGVYSWVPPAVQDHILEICTRNLTPKGVAYVSYNTYPGWHMRGMIREMMCYHARQFAEPLVRVKQARNLLDFLARSVVGENNPYAMLLKSELETLRQSGDSYLFHEHLEDYNEPIYFYQFIERATSKGLRYLGEVDLRVMSSGSYPPEVENVLQMLSPDQIHLEQYMDFLRNRTFRQTLLCHTGLTPSYGIRPEIINTLHVSSPARAQATNPNIYSDAVELFAGPDGVTLNSGEPIVKAAMVYLSEIWPEAVPFEDLFQAARSKLARGPVKGKDASTAERNRLAEVLLTCYTTASNNLVDLHVFPPPLVRQVSTRPVASPLARHQATTSGRVTNLRHQVVHLDEFNRHLIRMLDGTRDRDALVEALASVVANKGLFVEEHGKVIHEPARLRDILGSALDQQLPVLARSSLLVA